ncbi:hypothetical protein B4U79_11401, partial [Dinothrombium tinctorium]
MTGKLIVIPVYKKGDKSDCNNYRPISILPTCSKVFESIIYDQISDFIIQNNVIPKFQHGFSKNKSTFTNLLDVTNLIAK